MSDELLQKRIWQFFLCSLSSGLVLALLSLVAWIDIRGVTFCALWLLHLLIQMAAVLFGLRLYWNFVSQKAGLGFVLLLLLGALLLALWLQSALPIVSRDALIYHLMVPKLWLQAGRMVEVPWHEWSYIPLLLGLGYAGFLQFGLTEYAAYYHGSFLILSCATVGALAFWCTKERLLGALSFLVSLSIPICFRLGTEPMADAATALYMGIAVACLFFWGEKPSQRRELVFAGVALGLALSTKYNAILAVAILFGCFLVYLCWLAISGREAFSALLYVGLFSLLVYLPWPLRNFFWTGNPLYPFLGSLFGTEAKSPFMGKLSPLSYRLEVYGDSWWQVVLLPLRMLFVGEDGNPRLFDGALSPILLLALLPIFFRLRSGHLLPWMRLAYLFSFAYFAISISLVYALVRYQSPILVVVMVLFALGLSDLKEHLSKRVFAIVCSLIIAVHAVVAAQYGFALTKRTDTLEYLSAELSDDSYLRKHLSEYETISWVNNNLPDDAVVYLLFTGNRYFYYERQVRSSYFSADKIAKWLAESETVEEVAEKLKNYGVSHIAIHERRSNRVLGSMLNDREKQLWTSFVTKRLTLLHRGRLVSIWRIR